jgi:hypothetical protein
LDDTHQETDDPAFNYMYFVKVVSTSYLPLGHEHRVHHDPRAKDMVSLGAHGYESDGSVETHQYSVTSHKRSLSGGNAGDEGHKERIHAKAGIPGVFFSYVSRSQSLSRSSFLSLTYLAGSPGHLTDESDQP